MGEVVPDYLCDVWQCSDTTSSQLAKDGRWIGGNTPMGFTVRRVTTGSGKGKSAYSYLESLPEEKHKVQRLCEIFRTNRSIQTTAKQMNEE